MFQAFRALNGFPLCFGLLGRGYAATKEERAKTEMECGRHYPDNTQAPMPWPAFWLYRIRTLGMKRNESVAIPPPIYYREFGDVSKVSCVL